MVHWVGAYAPKYLVAPSHPKVDHLIVLMSISRGRRRHWIHIGEGGVEVRKKETQRRCNRLLERKRRGDGASKERLAMLIGKVKRVGFLFIIDW